MAWLLTALVGMLVALPFVDPLERGRPFEAMLLTAVLVAALLAVRGRVRTFTLALVLAALAVIGHWVLQLGSGPRGQVFFAVAFLAFVGFVIFHFLRFIVRAPRVNSEVLCAAVATYLLLALLWAAAYALVAQLISGSFSGVTEGQPMRGFKALYFSLITLTTIGYGDITPVSAPARMLAMLEAITGTMYMAVLIARLVSLHSSGGLTSHSRDEDRS